MPDDTNPYTPPRSIGELSDSAIAITHGNLEDALSGAIRLDAGDVIREAWARVSGMKGIAFVTGFALWSAYFIVLVAVWVGVLAVVSPDALSDFLVATEEINRLSTGPLFLILAVLQAPAVALLYLGLWNLGLRRSVDAPLRFADAFPIARLGPAIVVVLVMNLFTMLQMIHPLLSFVSFPVLYLLGWVFPLVLDRECSVVDAMRWSVTLTIKNVLPIFLISALVIVTYFAVACTMGIGGIWWLPFCINIFGVCYRNLCGVQGVE